MPMGDEHDIVRLSRDVGEADHVLGPLAAPVTLIEYGDYECPYCRRLNPVIQEMMGRAEGLRFAYRHFPIGKIHPNAARAAESAEAAAAQGRFWEMHALLFGQDGPLDDEHLARLARKAGLEMGRYSREMAEGVYATKVEEAFKTALYGDGVTGTPTLYLNGLRLNSVQGADGLLAAVREAGATVKAETRGRAGWLDRLRNIRLGVTRLRQ